MINLWDDLLTRVNVSEEIIRIMDFPARIPEILASLHCIFKPLEGR